MYRTLCALLAGLLTFAAAHAATPDLTNAAGFDNACAHALERAPATVQEQQAYAICNDVALVQHIWTFVAAMSKQYDQGRMSDKELALKVRVELRHMRDQLRKSRTVLEKIRITSPRDGLLIAPATWVRDLNGDGEVGTAERYFFAIPKRRQGTLVIDLPSDSENYYTRNYNLEAKIQLDQTDIQWALSYHYYLEALVQIALSYQYGSKSGEGPGIYLVYPANMLDARALLEKGMRTSEKMRQSALRETDNDHEWIGNPRQTDSSFPVPLDGEDFKIWGELMSHLIPLVEGKTLLPPVTKLDGQLGRLAQACPVGQGFDLTRIFQAPPSDLFDLVDSRAYRRTAIRYCRKIDRVHPASGLGAFLSRYAEQMQNDSYTGRTFLRNLLWVN